MSLQKPFQPAAFSCGCGAAGWLVPVPGCVALLGLAPGCFCWDLWGCGGGGLQGWGCIQGGRWGLGHPAPRQALPDQGWFLQPPLLGQSPLEQHRLCG